MVSKKTLNHLAGGLTLVLTLLTVWGCVEIDTNFDFKNNDARINVHKPEFIAEETVAVELPVVNHKSIRLETISGDIEIEGQIDDAQSVIVTAQKWVGSNSLVDAEVHSNVYLSNIFGNVDMGLANGSINGIMAIPVNGEIRFSTGNGDLNLSIPVSTSAIFSASVVKGAISASNLGVETSMQTTQSLTGTIGNGEGVIELGTINGNISVIGLN